MNAQEQKPTGRYATIHGLNMYYEIHGAGKPLVLIHGGGSTIRSNFGRILPQLAKTRQVIAVELQAHGHTLDIGRPLSFEQDADDVAALLQELHIDKADIMGFSNGGTTALQMAIRHPGRINKLILLAALYKRDGVAPGFWEGMQQATIEHMPQPLRDAYLAANPDPKGLQLMFERDVARMNNFKDISDADIMSIQTPALVINGDAEVIRVEHTVALWRTLPHAQLAILPGEHGAYIGEICTQEPKGTLPALLLIDEFLQ